MRKREEKKVLGMIKEYVSVSPNTDYREGVDVKVDDVMMTISGENWNVWIGLKDLGGDVVSFGNYQSGVVDPSVVTHIQYLMKERYTIFGMYKMMTQEL